MCARERDRACTCVEKGVKRKCVRGREYVCVCVFCKERLSICVGRDGWRKDVRERESVCVCVC